MTEVYKLVGHNYNGTLGGKRYCSNCGHVFLNNPFSHWYAAKGCEASLHPSYQTQRNKAGRKP